MDTLDQGFADSLRQWREASSEAQGALTEKLRTEYERNITVVCTDMSGFSRVTKEEGIIFFLANVKQMQGICLPIMRARGGQLIKVVADNLFVAFEDVAQAVHAAADCVEAVALYSEGKRRNEQIRISVGVDTGRCWVLHDSVGDAVARAFKLGEDVASAPDILVTDDVAEGLREKDASEWQLDEDEEDVDGDMVHFFRASRLHRDGRGLDISAHVAQATHSPVFAEDALPPFEVGDMPEECIDLLREHLNLRYSARRGDQLMRTPSTVVREVSGLYSQARQKFECKRAILVCELHGQAKRVREAGPLAFINLLVSFKDIVGECIRERGGDTVKAIDQQLVAETVGLFDSPHDALEAAIDAQRRVRAELECPVAMGLGFGLMFDLNAMNCFGDEVNMAFKLGEDTAHGGEILVTMPAIETIKADPRGLAYSATEDSVTLSGVSIPYVSVQFEQGWDRRESQDQDLTMNGMPWTRRKATLPTDSLASLAIPEDSSTS